MMNLILKQGLRDRQARWHGADFLGDFMGADLMLIRSENKS
jgi:hypothetical protein